MTLMVSGFYGGEGEQEVNSIDCCASIIARRKDIKMRRKNKYWKRGGTGTETEREQVQEGRVGIST